MDSYRNFFRNWFGYSRRERRSTFILLNIIVILTGIRYVFPFHEIYLREIPLDLLENNSDTSCPVTEVKDVSEQKQSKGFYYKREIMNLNSCDSASLESLPGIGPVLSARIIKYRNLLGGYATVAQLNEVYGLPEETFRLISSRVYADSLSVRKIRINSAEFKDLIRHPYFKRTEVSAILKYRELSGKITNVQVMVDNNLISPETARKIRAYLDFTD